MTRQALLVLPLLAACATSPTASLPARPVQASIPDRLTGSSRYQNFGDADATVTAAPPATMTGSSRYQEFSSNPARPLGGPDAVIARPGANGQIEPLNAEPSPP